jgi:hypothetical protein
MFSEKMSLDVKNNLCDYIIFIRAYGAYRIHDLAISEEEVFKDLIVEENKSLNNMGLQKINMQPLNLYKYQPLTKHSLDNIKNGTICMTHDLKGEWKDQTEMKPLTENDFYDVLLKKGFKPTMNSHIMTDGNPNINIRDFKEQMNTEIRKSHIAGCFTTKLNGEKLWNEYGDNNTGICIAYHGEDFINNENFSLAPISYGHKAKYFINGNSEQAYASMKDYDTYASWAFEWRIINGLTYTYLGKENPSLPKYYTLDESAKIVEDRFKIISGFKINFIVLGKNFDFQNQLTEELFTICKNKGIPMYKNDLELFF